MERTPEYRLVFHEQWRRKQQREFAVECIKNKLPRRARRGNEGRQKNVGIDDHAQHGTILSDRGTPQ
jgi:hypothetical protein